MNPKTSEAQHFTIRNPLQPQELGTLSLQSPTPLPKIYLKPKDLQTWRTLRPLNLNPLKPQEPLESEDLWIPNAFNPIKFFSHETHKPSCTNPSGMVGGNMQVTWWTGNMWCKKSRTQDKDLTLRTTNKIEKRIRLRKETVYIRMYKQCAKESNHVCATVRRFCTIIFYIICRGVAVSWGLIWIVLVLLKENSHWTPLYLTWSNSPPPEQSKPARPLARPPTHYTSQ